MLKRILLVGTFLLGASPAFAACSTVAGKDGNGSAITIQALPFGGTNCAGLGGVTDGTNTAAVKAASTAAGATDPAVVVAISPNNTPVLPTGAATSALQTTINTTLGSPFQAGASIGKSNGSAFSPRGLSGEQSWERV